MDKIFYMNRKNIAIMGILLSCIYFFTVIIFVATSSTNWLMVFDIVTMIAGIYYVFLIIGFFGWLIINENLWYIASMGYRIGAVTICIELLLLGKNMVRRGKKE